MIGTYKRLWAVMAGLDILSHNTIVRLRETIIATLQATRQWSAITTHSRLKQIARERPLRSTHTPELKLVGQTPDAPPSATPTPPASAFTHPYHTQLADLEQRQLLLQTVAIYPGWRLVSVHHRPDSDVLVAHLIPKCYDGDPVRAIREGHAMQLIMDATGDFRLQHARRKRSNILARCLRRLASSLDGGCYVVVLA
jgi:hypothetical protein